MSSGASYRDSGVDLEAADRAVELMKAAVVSTHDERVMSGLAEFGGLFCLGRGWRNPVLVSGTDSVGTKLKIAFMLDRHDTVGQDVVAMCVDDIVCHGAQPLFFLDYIGIGKLDPEKVATVVTGVANACRLAGCALIGGETAELPGLYAPGEYDLVGSAVGLVERDALITGASIQPGFRVVGLVSSGLHSNGFSLVRMVLLEKAGLKLDQKIPELGRPLGEELLEPTRIYAPALLAALGNGVHIAGLAHVTGGGIQGNLCRIIPDGLAARIRRSSIPGGPIFALIQELGKVADDEMLRTFNMGVGMTAVVAPELLAAFVDSMAAQGHQVLELGEIVEGEGPKVTIE
ncbi:MAG: phosphoribosylformylglycinamidine cyclo-ligase [Armatimonadota bacterium]